LSFRLASWRSVIRAGLQSFVVFVAAVAVVVEGTVVMASIFSSQKSPT